LEGGNFGMSASIEERVVSIKFDNAKFEANVKTTIRSLDSLKKSIDFSGGIKALGDLDAASKKIDLGFDNKAFGTSVQSTIRAADNLKKNLNFDSTVHALGDLDSAGKKVNLRLDPTAFQIGAKGVMDAATTIKQNLNFESVQRGFGNLKMSAQNFSFQNVVTGAQNVRKSIADMDLATKAVSFLPITDGAERAKTSISAMSIAGIAAIGALGAKAALIGPQMAANLFLDPAKSGLAEYETNLGSIQTIMSNTQWENKSLGDVNGALDELNAYSDKTIYNFAQMADSVGKFTSAGVSLDDSTAAIKGISNLAALSGSNSNQAATAMQQLSQEMAAGKVGLEGWNSVVNAGMGGKVFQDALIETARNQGSNVDALIKKNGSFRQSLQDGWVTTKVMNETLSKMTGDLTDKQLKAMGYNDDQIVGIQKMAKNAQDAATKIKTFSQLTGTLSETTGSGWSQTWKLILGDFEQAKEMWTNVYGVLGKLVQGSADARNNLLSDWNKLGGRTEMIWAVRSAFMNLMAVVTPIKEAFREVFPPTTGKQLYIITQNIRLFINALAPGTEQISLIKNTFKLLFVIIKIGLSIITGAIGIVVAFFKAFATGGDSVKGSMKPLTDFLGTVADKLANSTFVKDFFDGLAKGATVLGTALGKVVPYIMQFVGVLGTLAYDISGYAMYFVSRFARIVGGTLVDGFVIAITFIGRLAEIVAIATKAFMEGGLELALTRVRERLASFGRLGDRISEMWNSLTAGAARFWEQIKPLREAIAKMFGDIGKNISEVFSDVNFDDSLDLVNTGLLAGLFIIFRKTFKKLLGMGDGVKEGLFARLDTSIESINGVLDSLSGTLQAMQQNLKADTLMKIAIAIGILTISVVVLSMIDSGKLTKALIGIGVMVVILTKAMEALDKISMGSGFLKIPFIAASMILLAIAIAILAIPVLMLSKLSWSELLKGLAGVGVLMFFLSKAAESMAKNPANLIATGIGLIAVAIAIKILASAVGDFAKLSWGDMIKGLVGVGAMLTALSIFSNMTKANKGAIASGVGLILLGTALKIMASALSDFAAMNVGSLVQGLVTMALVLAMISRFAAITGDNKNLLKTAASLVIIGFALKIMASAIGDFAAFSWEELAKGLVGMTFALSGISTAMAALPKNMLANAIGLIAVGLALKIIASALMDMGNMSWEQIAKGLITLAGALLIISIAVIAMQGSILGAAAILIVAAAIGILAPSLKLLGDMSWDQILHGLAALAGIFIILGLAGLVLTPLVPVLFALGIALGMMGIGLFGVGLGTVLFAAGLIAITAALTVSGPLLIAFVMSLLALIPMAMEELGKGIVAFAGVIGNAMPVFIAAFVKLLLGLLTAIDIILPRLMTTLWSLIVALVDLIVRAVPLFVDAAMKILIGLVKGIADNIGLLIDEVTRLITEFIDGITRGLPRIIDSGVKLIVAFLKGIGDNVQKVTDAAADLIIKFVNGLAATIETKSQELRDAGLRLAGAIIDGMTGGLATRAKEVADGAWKMGQDALASIAGAIDSNSPSKETHKLGTYFGDGFIGGIASMVPNVSRSAGAMGTNAVDTLKKTISDINSVVPDNVEMTPTIRPVLDLSAVKKDSRLIGGMIKSPSLTVDTSYSRAASISASVRSNGEEVVQTKTGAIPETGTNVTFNQYNNSPKALSNAEIYRQSNNQISKIKEEIKK
jgi:tape measure domain-containing protein